MTVVMPLLLLFCVHILSSLDDESLHLLIIGDWGGTDVPPYTTSIQLQTRNRMDSIASMYNMSGIIALGDNFYMNGIQNEYDTRFTSTFENVYNTANLADIPWYVVAGNHDHHGNVSGEIEYSKHSTKWIMPSLYYSTIWNIPNSNDSLELILIDTYIICGLDENSAITYDCHSANETATDIQYSWLDNKLNTSNATYIMVGAHVPIFSYGFHGPQQQLITDLNPILKKYDNVISYIGGHEHDMQFIEINNQTLQYVVSGGGKECRLNAKWLNSPYNPPHTQSFKYHGCNQGGFVRLSINKNYAQMFYYEGIDDNIKFESGKWFPDHTYLTIDELKLTQSPTTSPTNVPTTEAIANPTSYPLPDNPTVAPIKDTTINPTGYPTRNPTKYPTINPTHYPSVNPSMNPSKDPTEYPTFYVLLSSTSIPIDETIDSGHKSDVNQSNVVQLVLLVIIVSVVLLVCIGILLLIYVYRKLKPKSFQQELELIDQQQVYDESDHEDRETNDDENTLRILTTTDGDIR